MKKYIASLFFVIFAFAASAEAFTPAPLNPDFIKWREGTTNEAQNVESAKARSASPVLRGGAIPAPKETSHLKDADFSMFLNEALSDGSRPAARTLSLDSAAALPVSYDLREEGRVTPVRHQGGSPLCWGFATNASLEV